MIKTYTATLDNLQHMLSEIKNHAMTAGFTGIKLSEIELATEEALVNIISYAYPILDGPITISCDPTHNPPGLSIKIQDHGIPYNPLYTKNQTQENNTEMHNVEHKPIGGYGILFIVKLTDVVDYKRIEEKNILTLIKYL